MIHYRTGSGGEGGGMTAEMVDWGQTAQISREALRKKLPFLRTCSDRVGRCRESRFGGIFLKKKILRCFTFYR